MSTLKVNAIEPYSGGTVTITGVPSSTYAAPVGGQTDIFTVTGAETEGVSYPTYTVGLQDYGGPDFGDAFVTEIFGPGFAYGTGHSISGKGLFVNVAPNGGGTAGKLRIEDIGGAASKATIQATNVQIDGNVTNNGGLTVSNGNILQTRPDNADVELIQNENYLAEFYGSRLLWKQGNETALQMGELNKVSLTMNSFTPDFSTDNLINIQSTAANGTLFDDWSGTWMNVPEAGTPVMKRGLTIEGLGDYVDDAAAATGGVPVNGVYRTGSVLKIRVV